MSDDSIETVVKKKKKKSEKAQLLGRGYLIQKYLSENKCVYMQSTIAFKLFAYLN